MRGILEACTDAELAATHVRIAAPSPTCWSLGTIRSDRNWPLNKEHFVPEGAEAAAAAAALRRGGKLAVAYAWLCGEASLAKETRKVVKEWGVPRTDVLFSGYYRRR